MTTATITEPTRAARLHWLASDAAQLAKRNLSHIRQIPEKLIDVTLQPLMFVLLFAYVFGGVIGVPDGSYREYLIGGVLVQTLAFGVMGPATSIATDLGEGIVDRLRSLPTSRAAYLLGHFMAEFLSMILALTVLLGAGLIVGWQPHTDVLHFLAAIAVMLTFAAATLSAGTLLGITARSPDSVQGVVFVLIFPMTFIANVFVPASGLPDGLRQVAEWNPISALAAAIRSLFGNPTAVPHDAPWPLEHPVAAALIWSIGLLAVCAPLCVWRFMTRTTN